MNKQDEIEDDEDDDDEPYVVDINDPEKYIIPYIKRILEIESNNGNIRAPTMERYNTALKTIEPHLKHTRIEWFTFKEARELFMETLKDMGAKSKKAIYTVLNKGYKYAIQEERYKKTNPMTCIQIKDNKYKDPDENQNQPLEIQEYLDVLKYINSNVEKNEQYALYLKIALLTGMRTNEILALKYKDINLDKMKIKIYKSMYKGEVDQTKTKQSNREIKIIKPLGEMIKNYYKKYLVENKVEANPEDFVFARHEKDYKLVVKHISPQTIKIFFKDILKKLGIKDRSLYSTRHSFASVMVSYGEDLGWVSHMLGHTNIAITAGIYAKYLENNKERAINFIKDYSKYIEEEYEEDECEYEEENYEDCNNTIEEKIIESTLLEDNEKHKQRHKNIVVTRHAKHELSPRNNMFSITIKPKDYKKHKLKTKPKIETKQESRSSKDEEVKPNKTRRKKAHEKYRDTKNKNGGGSDAKTK